MLKGPIKLLGMVSAAVLMYPTQSVQAQALPYTFNFDDEYFINTAAKYLSVFGTSSGYGTAGTYQKTNTTTPIVTKVGTGVNVAGEYIQNTSTNDSAALALFGWGQSLNNGQQVGSVYNVNNPINGTNTYFQYKTGTTSASPANTGTTTAFKFQSFDLRGSFASANLNFTLQGYLGGVLVDSAVLNVTGNVFQTYTENWNNVDTVVIASTSGVPVNWGSGTLYMDNIVLAPAAIPEPAFYQLSALLAMGGLGMLRIRKRRDNAPSACHPQIKL